RSVHVLLAHHADARKLGGLEPRHGSLNGPHHVRTGLLQAHQQPDDSYRLTAAEADQLVAAAGSRTVIRLIVLGAPGGRLAIHFDLALEDAFDASIEGVAGSLARTRSHKIVDA